MPPDLENRPALSASTIEHAEANITFAARHLTARLLPHYPKATVCVVFRTGERAHYLIETGRDRKERYAFGIRDADKTIDDLLEVRPPTVAEIEQTLGVPTAYSGKTHAA